MNLRSVKLNISLVSQLTHLDQQNELLYEDCKMLGETRRVLTRDIPLIQVE